VDEKIIRELIDRYIAVSFNVTKKAEALIKEQIGDDLTTDQHYILRHIYQSKECTSSELADVFEVNKSAITAIVNRMVNREWIQRTRDEHDRRVVYLTLTSNGIKLFEKMEDRVHCLVESIINQFNKEEIQNFIQTYEKLSDILTSKKDQLEE
jgi:DNA-binding MarR family transcriptional regulator